jgi:hypothetical protein
MRRKIGTALFFGCACAQPRQINPFGSCSILVAGSGDNPSSPGFSDSNQDGISLYPDGISGGGSDPVGVLLGIGSAAEQPIMPPDTNLANAMNTEAAMGSSIVLTGFSAGGSDIAATWNSLPASTQNQVILINLVSPGIPWGVPNFTNANGPIPINTFQAGGFTDNLVNAGNWVLPAANMALTGVLDMPYPGGVTDDSDCNHSFECENNSMGILPTDSNCPSVISSSVVEKDEGLDEEAVLEWDWTPEIAR